VARTPSWKLSFGACFASSEVAYRFPSWTATNTSRVDRTLTILKGLSCMLWQRAACLCSAEFDLPFWHVHVDLVVFDTLESNSVGASSLFFEGRNRVA